MVKQILNFLKDEEGASAVEYGLIVGLIAVAVVAVLISMGGGMNTLFERVDGDIDTAAKAP
ncbi:MAG: Flp family type IVb pilin [Stagnimonas sp.]|nr:Flp family type IVb pilin [Stagnimonas sp.]